MNYNQPQDEFEAIAERILKINHDSLAFNQPAVDTFYFALDAKRIAAAYLKAVQRPKRIVIDGATD